MGAPSLTPAQRRIVDIVRESGTVPITTAAYRAGCLKNVVLTMIRSGVLIVVDRVDDSQARFHHRPWRNKTAIVALAPNV